MLLKTLFILFSIKEAVTGVIIGGTKNTTVREEIIKAKTIVEIFIHLC